MMSKTKIRKRMKGKQDDFVLEIVAAANKNEGWAKIAQIISGSRRNYASVNLKEIDENSKEGDTIIVPGKVLGKGDIGKKVRVCAVGFSESAREKLIAKKGEIVTILEEIKKNPKAEGIKIIR